MGKFAGRIGQGRVAWYMGLQARAKIGRERIEVL